MATGSGDGPLFRPVSKGEAQLVGRHEEAIAVLKLESKLERIRTQIAEIAAAREVGR